MESLEVNPQAQDRTKKGPCIQCYELVFECS